MPEQNGPKQFDVNAGSNGLPDSELAGATPEVREKDFAIDVAYPMRFDTDGDKDFRPKEVQDRQSTPKGRAADYASSESSSATSTTGLEDVSSEDLATSVPTSVEKDSTQPSLF